MRLILTRHGQSQANVDPAYIGKDSDLTPLGEQQADRLGRWLQAHEPTIGQVVCSPLRRAYHTGQIICQYLELPLQINPDLAEVAHNELPAIPRRRDPFNAASAYSIPDPDSYYEQYCEQVRRALVALSADLTSIKPTLVVSHGGTNATLLRLIFERHDMDFHTYNTALHYLVWEDGFWQVDALNAVPHLDVEMVTL